MRIPHLLTLLFPAVFALSICGCDGEEPKPGPAAGLPKVTLQLNWFPEAEHGGFYAALQHGYF